MHFIELNICHSLIAKITRQSKNISPMEFHSFPFFSPGTFLERLTQKLKRQGREEFEFQKYKTYDARFK
jgi:hypothetical protein